MAKKEKKQAPAVPQINPEIAEAEKAYQRSVRITEGGPRLRRALLFLWASLDIVLLVIFLGYLGFYLTVASVTERKHVAGIAENIAAQNAITSARSAASLRVSDTQVFDLGQGEYDLYVEVENVNTDWYATFDYYFERNDQKSDVEHGFSLPGESRPLISFRQAFDSRPSGVDVTIENIEWQRVDHHAIADVEDWMISHNEFTLKDDSYALDHEVGDETIGRSTFTVENESPYGYFNSEFSVLILRGNVLAGVNTATIAGFETGESRDVTVNWFSGAPSSGTVRIVPNINYFDESVYMSLPTDEASDIRDLF